MYYYIGSFSHDNFAIRLAEPKFSFRFFVYSLVPKAPFDSYSDIKNSIAMLNARCLRFTHTSPKILQAPLFKEIKSFKNSNFALRVILLGIIQIQRSFNLQIVRNVWTDFFHVIQRILQQAAPGQRSRAGRALDGGVPTVANRMV